MQDRICTVDVPIVFLGSSPGPKTADNMFFLILFLQNWTIELEYLIGHKCFVYTYRTKKFYAQYNSF